MAFCALFLEPKNLAFFFLITGSSDLNFESTNPEFCQENECCYLQLQYIRIDKITKSLQNS